MPHAFQVSYCVDKDLLDEHLHGEQTALAPSKNLNDLVKHVPIGRGASDGSLQAMSQEARNERCQRSLASDMKNSLRIQSAPQQNKSAPNIMNADFAI